MIENSTYLSLIDDRDFRVATSGQLNVKLWENKNRNLRFALYVSSIGYTDYQIHKTKNFFSHLLKPFCSKITNLFLLKNKKSWFVS